MLLLLLLLSAICNVIRICANIYFTAQNQATTRQIRIPPTQPTGLPRLIWTTTKADRYIFGDFKNCTKKQTISAQKVYHSIISNSGYGQIIYQPTRISQKPSIIDHILCSKTENVSQNGVIPLGLSDHSLIYCTRKLSRRSFNDHNTVTIRSMKNYTPTNYADMLS